jgi:hypothetical protein
MVVPISELRNVLVFTATNVEEWQDFSKFRPSNGLNEMWEYLHSFAFPGKAASLISTRCSSLKFILVAR